MDPPSCLSTCGGVLFKLLTGCVLHLLKTLFSEADPERGVGEIPSGPRVAAPAPDELSNPDQAPPNAPRHEILLQGRPSLLTINRSAAQSILCYASWEPRHQTCSRICRIAKTSLHNTPPQVDKQLVGSISAESQHPAHKKRKNQTAFRGGRLGIKSWG